MSPPEIAVAVVAMLAVLRGWIPQIDGWKVPFAALPIAVGFTFFYSAPDAMLSTLVRPAGLAWFLAVGGMKVVAGFVDRHAEATGSALARGSLLPAVSVPGTVLTTDGPAPPPLPSPRARADLIRQIDETSPAAAAKSGGRS